MSDPAPTPGTPSTQHETAEGLIERWVRRLRRSHALFVEDFREEQFEELVSALVTSAFARTWLVQAGCYIKGVRVNLSR
jgi:hypothetical protein